MRHALYLLILSAAAAATGCHVAPKGGELISTARTDHTYYWHSEDKSNSSVTFEIKYRLTY